MARIIDLVRARKQAILDHPEQVNNPEAKRTGDLAILAVHSGIGSPAWANYMAHFGEVTPFTAEQMQRLNGTDGTLGLELFNKKRAYMVANGVCGIQSPNTQGLDGKVDTIDDGLPGVACDPNP